MSIIWVNKPLAWTPKQCVNEAKLTHSGKIAFAGRLDPLAYGILPLVINGNRSDAALLESSYKTYQFKIILGIQTDTYDILGLITNINPNITYSNPLPITEQEYPPFSSKTVLYNNKKVPLWKLSKEGIKVPLPIHKVDIEYFTLLDKTTISYPDILKLITKRISLVKGDFRQDLILDTWNNNNTNCNFELLHCEARVSSGTYIRGIANSMSGVAFDINRTQFQDITSTGDKYRYFEYE